MNKHLVLVIILSIILPVIVFVFPESYRSSIDDAVFVQTSGKLNFTAINEQQTTKSIQATTKTTTTTTTKIGSLYYCGYVSVMEPNTLELLFPRHEYKPINATTGPPNGTSTNDLFVTSELIGVCAGAWSSENDFRSWLRTEFAGKKVYRNLESAERWIHKPSGRTVPMPLDTVKMGYYPWGPKTIHITPLVVKLMEMGPEKWKAILDHSHKPRNTRQEFLIYAHSHCVPFRERALAQLSKINTVDAAGQCQGDNTAVPGRVRKMDSERGWMNNSQLYSKYRFCLTMENTKQWGYTTEKILTAFLSGCIPIYYGNDEIFEMFNQKAFVYYDVNNPNQALERIKYLEENATAYEEVMNEPILAPDREVTIEKFFSFTAELGGGKLQKRIHDTLGLPL